MWLSLALSALVSKCRCFLLWWNPGLIVFPRVGFLFLHTLNLFQNSNLMTEKPFKVLCCWPSSCTTSVTIFSSWTLHEGTACYCRASQTSAFITNHLMNFCDSELWNTPTINFALARLRKSLKMCIFSSLPRWDPAGGKNITPRQRSTASFSGAAPVITNIGRPVPPGLGHSLGHCSPSSCNFTLLQVAFRPHLRCCLASVDCEMPLVCAIVHPILTPA